MTWLAEVRVGAREAAALRLSDSYAWHAKVWDAFTKDDARNWLSRVDERPSFFRLYIVSVTKPEIPSWGSWRVREVGGGFLRHKRFKFELKANPTVKKWREGRKHGTRVGIYTREDLLSWLERKGKEAGFTLEAAEASPPVNQPFVKKGRRGNHKRVDYRGVLAVGDPEKFSAAFRRGIGPAKAFGFGMLVLKPIGGKK